MESLAVNTWAHLEHFGIKALTGEACSYMMRILCDVNEDGRLGILDYLSLPVNTVLTGPWNSLVNGKPSVGSIMLHRDCLPALAEFMLRRAGVRALVRLPSSGSIVGLFTEERVTQYEQLLQDMPNSTHLWQIQRLSGTTQPCIGSRNIHAATGRAL
ncbi:hypothetical protein HDG34_003195 [Paraburkholderia sp. HC6.4b]|uniref:hypothetical protein n=1 Tax=unclassified Paraburkholderia TaxID=2615204 RepID=UPI001613678A|nr:MULTISPECIES: hypothetical protein [unclassified Paraburkholderia]MBB5409254.1 hypothetical protein [Paraburkholderia sp. HC6.4b]MBB5450982.1 hypothetical protein [Paraburkholderia sp. Kb1A]